MTDDEFSAWRDDEITQTVFKWIEQTVHASEEAWGKALNGGMPDDILPMMRARLSERARLATEIINIAYEDLEDVESERDSADRVQSISSSR